MRCRATLAAVCCALPLMFVVGCGGDDDSASTAPTTTAPAATPAERIAEATAGYREYVSGQIDQMITDARVFTDAVRAGDIDAAREQFGPSRVAWESIEPIAGLIETIDTRVDVRADLFESLDDPEFTGWHRLEHMIFVRDTTDGATPFADRLDADLEELRELFATITVAPIDLARGPSELIEEVAEGKMTGEEDRYSKTDLWDLSANVEGARAALDLLRPALSEADPDLLARIDAAFAAVDAEVEPLREGDGFILFCPPQSQYPSDLCPEPTLTQDQVDRLKVRFAALAEQLAEVPGALGVS